MITTNSLEKHPHFLRSRSLILLHLFLPHMVYYNSTSMYVIQQILQCRPPNSLVSIWTTWWLTTEGHSQLQIPPGLAEALSSYTLVQRHSEDPSRRASPLPASEIAFSHTYLTDGPRRQNSASYLFIKKLIRQLGREFKIHNVNTHLCVCVSVCIIPLN